jgi:hypothetical protein
MSMAHELVRTASKDILECCKLDMKLLESKSCTNLSGAYPIMLNLAAGVELKTTWGGTIDDFKMEMGGSFWAKCTNEKCVRGKQSRLYCVSHDNSIYNIPSGTGFSLACPDCKWRNLTLAFSLSNCHWRTESNGSSFEVQTGKVLVIPYILIPVLLVGKVPDVVIHFSA